MWLNIFYLFLMSFVLVLLLILFLPLRFHLYYHKKGNDDDFVMEISPPRNIFHQKIVIPAIKIRDKWRKVVFDWEGEVGNEQEVFTQGEKKIDLVDEYHLLVGTSNRIAQHIQACSYLARYLRLHKFEFIVQVGTGDPAYTGFAAGMLWSLIPPLWKKILNNVQNIEQTPIVRIVPDFTGKRLVLCFDSIFTLKVGHIITIGSCILGQEIKRYIRKKKKMREEE